MALGKLYLDSNYFYGIADHANSMGSSPVWASAGIATDAVALMQSLATVGGSAMGATKFAAAAATPIINAGLMTLTVASNGLGFGRPEDGERFGSSAQQFADANSTLEQSNPPSDWEGDARDAYRERNEEQRCRTEELASFDRRVQEVLVKEAGQVDNTREFVSKRQTALAGFIVPALLVKPFMPHGPAMSMAIEIGAVAGTVPFAMQRVTEMGMHSSDNAGEIRAIGSRYESLAANAKMPGGTSGSAAGAPPPLKVSESIRGTAGTQQTAASTIDTARSTTDGSAGDVFKTHGLVCSMTAAALKSAELARRSAAEQAHLISTDLGLKLNSAATAYQGTDGQNARNLGQQMPPR